MTEGKDFFLSEGAEVDGDVEIGRGTRIWNLAQVRTGSRLGDNCVVGRGAYVGPGVVIGECSKVQNFAQLHEPAVLGRGVFIGPAAVLTNDHFPRATNPDGSLKDQSQWRLDRVIVEDGASIGALAVCVAPVRIGKYAMVAAGSVVTRDVPAFALVAGNPATFRRWISKTGKPLQPTDTDQWVCMETGEIFLQSGDKLSLIGASE